MDESLESVRDAPDFVTRLAVEYGPQVLSATLIMVVGFFVARWAARFAAGSLRHFHLEPPVHDLSCARCACSCSCCSC